MENRKSSKYIYLNEWYLYLRYFLREFATVYLEKNIFISKY